MAPEAPSPSSYTATPDSTPFHSPRTTGRPSQDQASGTLQLSNQFAALADQPQRMEVDRTGTIGQKRAAPSSLGDTTDEDPDITTKLPIERETGRSATLDAAGAVTRPTGQKRAASCGLEAHDHDTALAPLLQDRTHQDFANEHCADTEEALLTAMADGNVTSFTKKFSIQKCLDLLHDLQLPGHKKETKAVLVGRLQDHYELLFPEFAINHDLHAMATEFCSPATASVPTAPQHPAATPDSPLIAADGKRRRRTTPHRERLKTPSTLIAADTRNGNQTAALRTCLCALPHRPSRTHLFRLRDVDLRAILRTLKLPRINRGGKSPMVQQLCAWLDAHPDEPLPLPDDMQRSNAEAHYPTGSTSNAAIGRPWDRLSSTQPSTQHSPVRRSQSKLSSQPSARGAPPPSSSRSYAAVAQRRPPPQHPSLDHAALGDILQRAQLVLQKVVELHQLSPSSAHPPPNAELVTLANTSMKELQAARAGLAAATALSSPTDTSFTPSARSTLRSSSRPAPPSSSKVLIDDRCLVLDPPDDRLRRLPSDFSRMGPAFTQALSTALSLTSSSTPIVEMLRRTSKGGYCVQLFPSFSVQARALSTLTLPDGTIWRCTPLRQSSNIFTSGDKNSRPVHIRRDSFIVTNVPDSIADSDLLQAFAASNAERLQLSPGILMARLQSAERLQRRLSYGPEAGKWVPSRSVRFQGEISLVSAILDSGHVVLDFQALEVRHYSFPSRHCFHCGSSGHVAKHCRSRCHRCDSRHPTQPCPLHKHGSQQPARSQDLPSRFSSEDVTGTRPAGATFNR